MRHLILSDIHANWEALQGVLEAADNRYDDVVCLGDMVGYGADPNAVTDWVREHCRAVIRGNHDKACSGVEEPTLFNPVARAAVEWSFEQLSDENLGYLRALPKGPLEVTDFVIVHGSIRDEDEYLLDPRDAAPQFEHAARPLTFFGHTHVQGGFFLRSLEAPEETPPGASSSFRLRDGDVCLVNPGSVGQPRDFVWESGFAIYDSETRTVEYRRCPYDIASAQEKIRDAGLPATLADRLTVGR